LEFMYRPSKQGRDGRTASSLTTREPAKHRTRRALALEVLGYPTPPWEPAPEAGSPSCPLLGDFEAYLAQHRGNPPVTRRKKIAHITAFLAFLRSRQRNVVGLELADIDAFIVACRQHCAHTTVADMASSLRGFLRWARPAARKQHPPRASLRSDCPVSPGTAVQFAAD